MMKSLRRKKEGGFTLVELMIVIAIIGILAAIAIPQFAAYRERGFISSMQADCSAIRTAQESYFADNNKYTSATGDLANNGLKTMSSDNAAAIDTTATSFKVTITSSKTAKKVIYDSTTGTTVTQ